jgi:hypothetical protein
MYTSHMTGFASLFADNLVLGNMRLVLSAISLAVSSAVSAAHSPPFR